MTIRLMITGTVLDIRQALALLRSTSWTLYQMSGVYRYPNGHARIEVTLRKEVK